MADITFPTTGNLSYEELKKILLIQCVTIIVNNYVNSRAEMQANELHGLITDVANRVRDAMNQ